MSSEQFARKPSGAQPASTSMISEATFMDLRLRCVDRSILEDVAREYAISYQVVRHIHQLHVEETVKKFEGFKARYFMEFCEQMKTAATTGAGSDGG